MVTHATSFAWRIPWTEEPGGPQSKGSQRAGHDGARTQMASYCPEQKLNQQPLRWEAGS